MGIAASFAAIIGDGDGFPRKPDPTAALSILAKVGVSPDGAVVVGDGLPDMRLARALGVTAVAATWGYVPAAALAGEGPRVCRRLVSLRSDFAHPRRSDRLRAR